MTMSTILLHTVYNGSVLLTYIKCVEPFSVILSAILSCFMMSLFTFVIHDNL